MCWTHLFCRGSLPILLLFALSGCRRPADPLEAVKAFRPEDPTFKVSLVGLHFVTETQPIARVDSAFAKLWSRYRLPVDAQGCQDGVYEGSSPYDAFDYRHVVRLEVEDGAMVAVDYDEVHRDGHGKEADAAYNQAMAAHSASSPAQAYPHYEKTLLDRQNLSQVDAVSGATYSLYRFRFAAAIALMKARLD